LEMFDEVELRRQSRRPYQGQVLSGAVEASGVWQAVSQ
jgi:hypothetical protein